MRQKFNELDYIKVKDFYSVKNNGQIQFTVNNGKAFVISKVKNEFIFYIK